ncbi:MAG: ribonuclease HI [Treponema sp.]|uniref:ribonuclease HI n=1 Tax=Treponema sp. TaxID=166 RepID=UPI001E0A15AA|nr:ribonuclease HI [Treponema sp.]MBS7310356.1 ribonuclease HI [Treponema sp.]MCQ2600309.1 ribonuclease HI [Treponema sp.]MDD5811044.1 ribonuclease HI [Treponema sp.]MDY5886460.1 ribonuclease HI [Treponema sp.]
MENDIVIYTDGGCSGNPGPGGWGAVILADGKDLRISGGEHNTTNNRMELMAAISALSTVANTPDFNNRPVSVYADSQYVKNGITSWITNWKKNGWRTAAKKPVLNQDLWQKLDALNSSLNVSWNWVKGHAGIEYNEVCDQLCQTEIAKNR